MPFSIDLDAKHLGWSNDEAALLAEDAEHAWLTGELPAGTHCRPDGGPNGRWVKLGWAYNKEISEPEEDLANEATFDNQFPEIVMRGAAAFIPALKPYIESPPARFSHYGGYYTMTEENWPIIGPLDNEGAFVIGALSGFGSMAACAAGKLCAMHTLRIRIASVCDELESRAIQEFRPNGKPNKLIEQGIIVAVIARSVATKQPPSGWNISR